MSDSRERAARLAQQFHEAYERLAPSFGYETRKASAKPWAEVPEQNRNLMIAVCAEIALEAESQIAELTRHRDQWEQSYKEYRGINDEVQAKLRVELEQAREALRKIREHKRALDADACDNPSSHASCLDSFAETVHQITDEALSRKENKDAE